MLMGLLLVLATQAAFDTTVAVAPDTRLEVVVSAGSIEVAVWDRTEVRIVARPERGARVGARLEGAVLQVRATVPGGGLDLVSYQITVPRRMNLTLGRSDVDITVHGSEGAIDAQITSGKILIEGGHGTVSLRSFDGPIEVRGARAMVTAESSMGPITLRDVRGDVQVSSTSNHLTLQNIDTRNLRAASVSGTIRFSGPLHEDGRYALIAHSGSVFLRSTTEVNATISVASVNGGFATPLLYTVTERRRARIFTARFGNGGAQVTMESFNGGLVVEQIRP